MKKELSAIHITRGMDLMPNFGEGPVQLDLLAVYLAPATGLVAAMKDPEKMETFLAQAAELPAEEAAEILADFFEKLAAYNARLAGCLPREMKAAVLKVLNVPTPDSSSSNS